MRRLSAAGLAVVGLLTPMGTHALGVGEIKLQSYLNQALRAEIPLVLSEERPGDIKISLASPRDFEVAGLERSPVLSKLRFDVQPNSNGQFSIRVRTSEIIREPFLSFLMELTWPQGRMVRSFTVLLDPPELTAAQNFPRIAAEPGPASARPDPIEGRRLAAPTNGEANPGQGEYGPVGRNEKLWAIAEKINQDSSITTEQMVIALFRLNPQAFSRPSVNALNAGAVLRIPTRETIVAISPSLAREEFYRHQTGRNLRWRKASPNTAKPAPSSETAANPVPDSQGPTAPPTRTEPYVRSDAGMQGMEALRRENEEMRTRLAELEKRVSELQALFAARETASPTGALAGMSERNSESTGGQHPERSLEAPAPAAVDAAGPASGALPGTPITAPAAVPPKTAVKAAENPSDTSVSLSSGVTRDSSATATQAPGPSATPSPPNPTAVPDEPSRAGWWLLGGAASTLAGLSLLHLYRIRKSARVFDAAEPTETPPMDEGPHPSALSASADAVPDSLTRALKAESEEVDPIFEADIYVSYGKYDQAREAVEHAIRRHPERGAYRLKLLEICAAQGDRQSFESTLHELKERPELTAGPFWARVRELEQRWTAGPLALKPDPGEGSGGVLAGPKERTGDDTDRLIDDLQRFSLEARNKVHPGTPENTTACSPDLQEPTARKAPDPTRQEIPWVPVDSSPPPTPPEPGTDEIAVSTVDRDRLIPFASASALGPLPPSTDEESTHQTIETLLKKLAAIHYEQRLQADASGAPPSPPAEAIPETQPRRAEAPETSGRSGKPAERLNSPRSEVDGFSNADDVETKLDLAKAYADMGDYAQARDFLREVMEQGSVQQQEKAAQLLATFSTT